MKKPIERRLKFTKASVEKLALPAGETDFAFYDEAMKGFGIRFRAGGTVGTYFIQYAIGGKHRRIQLGRADQVTLTFAQGEAQQLRAKIARKIDPANERAKASVKASDTFNPAYVGYLAKLKEERSASYYGQAKMYLETHFKPLHGMALTAIDRKTVSDHLKIIGKRGPITMNRARSTLSAFFNWAIREGFEGLENNPAHMTNKNAEAARQRDFSHREIKKIWNGVPDNEFGDIVRLLMLTMQRRDEIACLPMREFNVKERQLEIAKERSKNGKASTIPLSDAAFDILIKYHTPGRKMMFGANDTGFCGWTKSKERLDEILKLNEHWTFHDFRRCGKTAMEQDLDVPENVSEAILNHAKKGLAVPYNGATYIKQKREALDKYAAWLIDIIN